MSFKSLKEYYEEFKALDDDHDNDKALAYAQYQVNRDRDRIPGPLILISCVHNSRSEPISFSLSLVCVWCLSKVNHLDFEIV
jgi:hypothetical protein